MGTFIGDGGTGCVEGDTRVAVASVNGNSFSGKNAIDG
jgi:hypothetical protein